MGNANGGALDVFHDGDTGIGWIDGNVGGTALASVDSVFNVYDAQGNDVTDLVALNTGGAIVVARNNGSGAFTPTTVDAAAMTTIAYNQTGILIHNADNR